jgi:hypothetical protein
MKVGLKMGSMSIYISSSMSCRLSRDDKGLRNYKFSPEESNNSVSAYAKPFHKILIFFIEVNFLFLKEKSIV